MDLKLYRAVLHTGDYKMDPAEAAEFSEEEIEVIETYMKAWDGVHVNVCQMIPGEYSLVGWPPEEDEKVKEAIYLMEQDAVFGSYQDDRARFDADWAAGEWEPADMIGFLEEEVEILEELKGKRDAKE